MDEAFWDKRYGAKSKVWSGKPNPHLISEVTDLAPGRALDVGAGEGADSIWLALQGWEVTGLDVSSVALARAKEHVDALEVPPEKAISWLHADLQSWQPPRAHFGLVSIHFLHMPSAQRAPIYRRLAAAIAPGGALLIVGHHPLDLETQVRRPGDPDLLFTAEELAEQLEGHWELLVQEARPRGAKDVDGNPATVHDAVLMARLAG